MAPTYGIDNFLDCDVSDSTLAADQPSALVQRPWTKWWPPHKDRTLSEWLSAEFPEALTWRFDPEDPFNRPWQKWNKIARAKNLSCPSAVLPPCETGVSASNNGSNASRSNLSVGNFPGNASSVDDLIQTLHLPSVVPEQFNYLAPQDLYMVEKPYHSRLPFLNGLKRTNIVGQSYNDVQIYDLTGSESNFSLRDAGFEFVKIPVQTEEWTDSFVRESYLLQMAKWLETRFGCTKAHMYAYNFRSRGDAPTTTEPWIGPFLRAHADVTTKSSVSRLKLHLSLNDETIKTKKFRLVALWRPLSGPRLDCPLAVCHYQTVSHMDVVGADVVFPHYCDESYEVLRSSAHRWFFKSEMTANEAILFNLFDPTPGNATFCVHSAFVDPRAGTSAAQRRSVELRAILEW